MKKIFTFIKKVFLVFLVAVLSILAVATKPAPIIQWKPELLAVKVLTIKKIIRNYEREIRQVSILTGVEKSVIISYIATETLGNKNVCSKANACGLMQTRKIADLAEKSAVRQNQFEFDAGRSEHLIPCFQNRCAIVDVVVAQPGIDGAERRRIDPGESPVDML